MAEKSEYLIEFESQSIGYGNVRIENVCGYGIGRGLTAVVGRNGSGKSTFGRILEKGRYAYGNRLRFASPGLAVRMLAFSDIHSLSGQEVQYFAQRMESTMNDYVPTVAEVVGDRALSPEWKRLCSQLSLEDCLDKKVNFLSSGELRKLIIVKALVDKPDVLILDNPYIGLDASSRVELDSLFSGLREAGTAVVLLLCDADDCPAFTDSVVYLESGKIGFVGSLADFREAAVLSEEAEADLSHLPARVREIKDFKTAFEIRQGLIKYGERVILDNFNWRVGKGECWVLTGRNGSGKSLLLSMICADNPQGYANDIILFDRRRGTGESIWDIKDSIGYVSPEMQLFFRSDQTVADIVARGKRNSLDRYAPLSETDINEASLWMKILGVAHLAERKFNTLSSGEQRLALLAAAMIRQPELLVLDEPLHGLDRQAKKRVMDVIDFLVKRNETTLIYVTHYDSEIPPCVGYRMDINSRHEVRPDVSGCGK